MLISLPFSFVAFGCYRDESAYDAGSHEVVKLRQQYNSFLIVSFAASGARRGKEKKEDAGSLLVVKEFAHHSH